MKFRRVVTFTRKLRFESSVISYGSQTNLMLRLMSTVFESSVISYGSQTRGYSLTRLRSLRVV